VCVLACIMNVRARVFVGAYNYDKCMCYGQDALFQQQRLTYKYLPDITLFLVNRLRRDTANNIIYEF